MKFNSKSKGFTLIELVLSITIISIALTGVLFVFITVARSSSDPLIVQQSLAIAKSYLEEIIAKDFPATTPCPAPPGGGRANYITVCDYNGLVNNGARDQNNQLIAGLESYTVSVNIAVNAINFGSLGSGSDVVRIDVQVTHPEITALNISGYRTRY